MKRSIFKAGLLSLLLTAALAVPAQLLAQTQTNAPAEKKAAPVTKSATKKKPVGGPFHGKLASVDKTARTITVGKRTFQVTSATKIKKGNSPALFDEAVVGETVSGYFKPAPDGKLVLTTLNLGSKAPAKPAEKQPEPEKK